jgi:hypothetical protein
MALEAGDMEDGQLSDSGSDMTVESTDRPPQVPVSVRARGGPGRSSAGTGRARCSLRRPPCALHCPRLSKFSAPPEAGLPRKRWSRDKGPELRVV